MSSFLLPPLSPPHSYTSSTGLGSPCMGGSTGSIQPGVEKTGIFIENAASLFLLSKTEYRTTPHVGGDAGIESSSNEWEAIGQQNRDLLQAHFRSSNFRIFPMTVSKCGFFLFSFRLNNLRRLKRFKGAQWSFLVNTVYVYTHGFSLKRTVCLLEAC